MKEPKHRSARMGLVAGVTVGAVMTIGVAAYAASMSITNGSIGTQAAAQTSPCGNAFWTMDTPRTRFVTGTNRYEIASADVTVPAACQSPAAFRMVVMNNAAGNTPVGNGNAAPNDGAKTGALGAGPSTQTWTAGQGPLLNNISNGDPSIRFLVMIRG
ncbi:MAG: hypothetical protein ACOYD0_12100 [Candidatus Nanopelagicales bacterium]